MNHAYQNAQGLTNSNRLRWEPEMPEIESVKIDIEKKEENLKRYMKALRTGTIDKRIDLRMVIFTRCFYESLKN